MHFVFLCKTSCFLLQHAMQINIGDNFLIHLCMQMNYNGNNSSTNTYIHFYHQYEKMLEYHFLACGLDEISGKTVGTVMF